MSKAYGALKVAGICDVNNRQNRVGFVVGAKPAVIGTRLHGLGARVLYSLANLAVIFEPVVRLGICPVNVFEMSMLRTVFDE
jgi:hypothetical protein